MDAAIIGELGRAKWQGPPPASCPHDDAWARPFGMTAKMAAHGRSAWLHRPFAAALVLLVVATGAGAQENRAPTLTVPFDNPLLISVADGPRTIKVDDHFSDPDGDELECGITNFNFNIVFDAADGEGNLVILTPKFPGFFASSQVSFRCSDGGGLSEEVDIFVEVVRGSNNRPPTIAGAPGTRVVQDSPYEFTPTGSDADGSVSFYTVSNRPPWAAFNSGTGRLSGTPPSGPPGSGNTARIYRNIRITAFDDGGSSASLAPFDLEVVANRRPPAFRSMPVTSVKADEAYSYTPAVVDPEGGELSYTIVNRPSWATFSPSTGGLSGTPGSADEGTHGNVQIVASDGRLSFTQTFDLEVGPPNRRPVLSSNTLGTSSGNNTIILSLADGPITIKVDDHFSDPDGDELACIGGATSTNEYESSLPRSNLVTLTPLSTGGGLFVFSMGCFDGGALGEGLVQQHSFNIEVVADSVSGASPTITGTPETTVAQGSPYSFAPDGVDADNDPLTWSIINRPPWATFNRDTGLLSGTPGNGDVGVHEGIMISVSDGRAIASLPSFNLAVTDVDDPPTITGAPGTRVGVGGEYFFQPSGEDVDGDELSYSISPSPNAGLPAWAYFDPLNGSLSGRPGSGDLGTTSGIVISVTAGGQTTSLASFDLEVAGNSPPTITGTPVTIAVEGSPYSFEPVGADVDGDPLSYSISFNPIRDLLSWASIDPNTGRLSGTPENEHVGTYQEIVISVTDSGGASTPLASFDLEVENVNDPPTISGTPPAIVAEDSEYSFRVVGSDVDVGDSLTYSITNGPAWLSIDSDGNLTGTPGSGDVDLHPGIVVSVRDRAGLTDSLPAFDLQVAANSSQPRILLFPLGFAELGVLYSFTLTGQDDDPGTRLIYTIANNPSWLTIGRRTGVLSGTPGDIADLGSRNITLSVSDGRRSVSLSFDLTVGRRPMVFASFDEPIALSIEDGERTLDLNDHIRDPDGDDLSCTASTPRTTFTASLNTSSSLLTLGPVSPGLEERGLNITCSDNLGNITFILDVRVQQATLNRPPTIASGDPPPSVAQGEAYAFTVVGEDEDGDALTYEITTGPAWLTIDSDGNLAGTPDNDDVSFTSPPTPAPVVVRVSDGRLHTDLSFDLTVINVNDPPTITSGDPPPSVDQDETYTFTVEAEDVDENDTLAYSITTGPDWLSIDPDGNLSGTPGNGDVSFTSTPTSIEISVSDGAASVTLSFGITVADVNDAPTISGAPPTIVAEDTRYSFTPVAEDVDLFDNLSYSISNNPSWLRLDDDDNLVGTPRSGDAASNTGIVITVSDGRGGSADLTFDLTVAANSSAPTISEPQVLRVRVGSPYSASVAGQDEDEGTTLTYTLSGSPGWLSIDSDGNLAGTPLSGDLGPVPGIVASVSDGRREATVTFDLEVAPPNRAPEVAVVFVPTSLLYHEEGPLTINLAGRFIDPDGDELTYFGSVNSRFLEVEVDPSSGVATVTTTRDDDILGFPESLVLGARDADGLEATVTVGVRIQSGARTNTAPTIGGVPPTTAFVGRPYLFEPVGDDADGDTLTYSINIDPLPGWLDFDPSTGALSGTPGSTDSGTNTGMIVISVADETSSARLIAVLPAFVVQVAVNNEPTITSGTPPSTVPEDSEYSFTVVAEDVDVDAGDALTYGITTGPSWLTIDPLTGELGGTPDNDDVETTRVVVTVSDQRGGSAEQAFELEVENVNDAPTISGTPPRPSQDSPYAFTPVVVDVDVIHGDTLTYTMTGNPDWLRIDSGTGELSGTPRGPDVGTTTGIVIRVTDASGSSAELTFDLEVTPPNRAPVVAAPFDDPQVLYVGDGTQRINLADHFIDPDGDVLEYFGETSILSAANQVSVDRANGLAALSSFSTEPFTVEDGLTLWAMDSRGLGVTVTLDFERRSGSGSNSRPTITGNPGTTVVADRDYEFTPGGGDVDAGDTLTYSIHNQPVWADFDPSTGRLHGTPRNENAGTTTGIVISVSDGELTAVLAAFDLRVTGNNAPTIASGTPPSTVLEDSGYSFTVVGEDEDADDTLTYTISRNKPGWLNIDPLTGELSGTPRNEDVGPHEGIVVSVSDGGQSADLTISIEVINTNDAPTVSGTPPASAPQDRLYSFMPVGDDVDAGDTLSWSIAGNDDWLSIDPLTGELSGTPTRADFGTTSRIVVSVMDGDGESASLTFDLEVTPPNSAPVVAVDFVDPQVHFLADGALTINLAEHFFDPDGDALTYFGSSNDPRVTVSVAPGSGLATVSTGILFSTTAGDALVLGAMDDGGLEVSVALDYSSVAGSDTNSRPTISGVPGTTVLADRPYSFAPVGVDADTGDTLAWSIHNRPAWASFDPLSGALSGTPDNGDAGTTSGIVISVSDGAQVAVLPSFDLQVVGNSAPTIEGDPVTIVDQGAAYLFEPEGMDTDGDTLAWSIENRPGWAEFDDGTGVLSGTPDNGDVGTTSGIVISVTDGGLTVSLAPFELEVVNVNDAPTIDGDPDTSVDQGAAYSFTPGGGDVDVAHGDTLTYGVNITLPAWLILDPSTGVLSGTPDNDDVGTTTGIVIRVTDGSDAFAELQAFDLEVVNVNDAPTIVGEPATSVDEDREYSFAPGGGDVDVVHGDTLTYDVNVTLPTWLILDPSTGVLSGRPGNDDVGTTTGIVIRVTDRAGLAGSLAAFDLEVVNVNDPPTISGAPPTRVAQGDPYSLTVVGADVDDGDTLAYSLSGGPGWLSLDPVSGILSGTPGSGDLGTTRGIVVSVTDRAGASASLPAFAVTVTGANAPPTISGTPATTVAQGDAYLFEPVGVDPDGDTLAYSVENLPAWASFSSVTGRLAGTPGGGDVDTFSGIVISVSDGSAGVPASLGPFAVTVTNVNDAPTISGAPPTRVAQGGDYSFTPVGNDEDAGDMLSYSIVNNPAWLSIDPDDGILGGSPASGDVGTTRGILVSVTDRAGASASLPAFAVTVTEANAPPTISGTPATTVEQGSAYLFEPVGMDPDGDTLAYSVENRPAWASFSRATGQLSGTPGGGDVGTTRGIVVSVSDGIQTASLAAFAVTVGDVNDAPTISGTPPTRVAEGGDYLFEPVGEDLDGDTLSYSVENLPAWASFSSVTGRLAGTPGGGDVGTTAGILISVSDGNGGGASLDAFDLEVVSTNTAPTIGGTPASTVDQGAAYLFEPVGEDADGDTLAYSIVNQPAWAVFDAATGTLSGTPGSGDVGTTSGIAVSVSDGSRAGTVPLAPFDITVENTNDAPTISGTPPTQVSRGSFYSFTPEVDDVDGDRLTFMVFNEPGWAAFDPATGRLNGTPGDDDAGTTRGIVIRVSDMSGGSASLGPFAITVLAGANAPPTISGTPGTSVAQGDLYSFTPAGEDVDGDTLAYSIENRPSWATFSAATGRLHGTPGGGDVGTTRGIVVSVSDGGAGAVPLAPFDLEVTNVNDAPTISGAPSTRVAQGDAYSFTPAGGDLDGDTLEYSINIAPLPAWLTFSSATGRLSGTPGSGDVGTTAGIVISVSDGNGGGASLDAFDLEVITTNTIPTIEGVPETSVNQDADYLFIPVGFDADGDTLTYSIVNQPAWAEFDAGTGALSGTPGSGDVGVTSGIVVSVSDGSGSGTVALAAFAITVVDVNDAPTIGGTPPTRVAQGGGYLFAPVGADADRGDTLTYSINIAPLPGWLSFDTSTGALSGTPGSGDVGTTTGIVISVSDGSLMGTVSLPAFDLEVVDTNTAPTISGTPGISVAQGGTYSFTPVGSDADGSDTLAYSINISPLPGWLSFDTSTGALGGTPGIEDVGTIFGIVISVTDGSLMGTVSLPAFDLEVTANAPVEETMEAISQHLETSTRLILASQPKVFRRINRLRSGVGTERLSIASGEVSKLVPFEFDPSSLGTGSYTFTTSLDQINRAAAHLQAAPGGAGTHERRRHDVWFEGSLHKFNSGGGSSGDFSHSSLGADYLLSPDLLVGGALQHDRLSESNSGADSMTDSRGWMVAPYVTARLRENLYLDARVGGGMSDTDIRPPGATHIDSFTSTRWLVDIGLSGELSQGQWSIRPNASLSYLSNQQRAYTDSLGAAVPGQTVSQGQLSLGPAISRRFLGGNGWLYEPTLALDAVYSHADTSGAAVGTDPAAEDGWRARVAPGLSITGNDGVGMTLTGTYDGIGQSGYESWGFDVNLGIEF